MEQRVEVYGTSREDLNGKRGVAIDFSATGGLLSDDTNGYGFRLIDPEQYRYAVLLDSGETLSFRHGNVRAERAGGGSVPRAKAKRKGRGEGK